MSDRENAGLAEAKTGGSNVSADFRMNRFLSAPLTALFLRTPLTPNQITLLSLASGIAAGFLFSLGTARFSVFGALLYVLACVLDDCDGNVARAKNLSSTFGAWLDLFGDYATDACLFTGIAAGMFVAGFPGWQVFLPLAACLAGLTLHFLLVVAEKKRGTGPAVPASEKAPAKKSFLFSVLHSLRSGDACWLVLAVAAAGRTPFLLWFGTIYLPAVSLGALTVEKRKNG